MTSLTPIFDLAYSVLPTTRTKIRIDGSVEIARAISSGLGASREFSEQGAFSQFGDSIRLITADIPTGKCMVGDVVEISVNGAEWAALRIVGTRDNGGVMTLTMGAENG